MCLITPPSHLHLLLFHNLPLPISISTHHHRLSSPLLSSPLLPLFSSPNVVRNGPPPPTQSPLLHRNPTTLLKVNIHCHGCEAKVKKVLEKLDGVRTVHVDAEEGNVTVVSIATIAADTLIGALSKNGKHAEALSLDDELQQQQQPPRRLESHLQQLRLDRRDLRHDKRSPARREETQEARKLGFGHLKEMVVRLTGRDRKYEKLRKVAAAVKLEDDERKEGICGDGKRGFASAPQSPLVPKLHHSFVTMTPLHHQHFGERKEEADRVGRLFRTS